MILARATGVFQRIAEIYRLVFRWIKTPIGGGVCNG